MHDTDEFIYGFLMLKPLFCLSNQNNKYDYSHQPVSVRQKGNYKLCKLTA